MCAACQATQERERGKGWYHFLQPNERRVQKRRKMCMYMCIVDAELAKGKSNKSPPPHEQIKGKPGMPHVCNGGVLGR